MRESPSNLSPRSSGNPSEEEADSTNPLNQLSKGHMSSQTLKRQAQTQHGSAPGPLNVYHSFQLSVFMRFMIVRSSGSLTVMSALEIIFLLLGCYIQLQYDFLFASLYFILSC